MLNFNNISRYFNINFRNCAFHRFAGIRPTLLDKDKTALFFPN